MPLGGLLPYDEEDMEMPVSPQFGDLNDMQEMGPGGDRDLMAGGEDDLLQRLARKKMPMPSGLPQVGGQPAGVSRFMEEGGQGTNMEAVRALLQGLRG